MSSGPNLKNTSDEEVVSRVAERVAARFSGVVDSSREISGRVRFVESMRNGTGHRSFSRRLPLAVGAMGIAALLVSLRMQYVSPTALDFRAVGLEQVANGDYTVASTRDDGRLLFSDGSRIVVGKGAQTRLDRIDGNGADVSLTEGELFVSIEPLPNSRWILKAGPFKVRVTGTEFSIAWVEKLNRFAIHMERGSVEITGPGRSEPTRLKAGQGLMLDRMGRVVVPVVEAPKPANTAPASTEIVAPPAVPEVSTVAMPEEAPPEDERPAHATPSQTNWPEWVAAGQFARVVDAAKVRSAVRGVDRLLGELSLAELAALADASRYVGETNLGAQALLAQTRRFPNSERSAMATFLLGRHYQDGKGGGVDLVKAISWYQRYLSKRPDGTFAEEALSRMMLAWQGRGRSDEAARVASEYLRRFPSGAFAESARRFAKSP
jgi:FecR protein